MPIRWSITEDRSTLIVEGIGAVTDAEYLSAHDEWFAASALPDAPRYAIADWSGVTGMGLTTEALRASAERTRAFARALPEQHARLAVVGSSDLAYGLSRMWENLVGEANFQCHVFRTRAEAMEWLRS